MKRITSLLVAVVLAFAATTSGHAQARKEKVNLANLPGTVIAAKGDNTDEFHIAEVGKDLGKARPRKHKAPDPQGG